MTENTNTPTQDLDAYRVRIRQDHDYAHDECDGKGMPMSAERYIGQEYCRPDGTTIPHAEYLTYYGDPDRHVVLDMALERRCACCGAWTPTGDSLGGIDFMDDSPEVDRIPAHDGDRLSVRELLAVEDYLAEVTRDLLSEAGVELPAPAKEDA